MRGFTLIELMVVMVLMGILAAVAGARFFGRGDFEGPAFVQELASAARYAQKLAVTGGCPVQFRITSTTHYELKQPATACDTTLFTRDVLHPGSGAAFAADTPAGVTIGGAVPLTVEFSARGTPTVGGAEPPGNLVVTVGGQAVVITVRSGYVEVQ